MTESVAIYEKVVVRFTDLVDAIANSQWSVPTPCAGRTVHDLVEHVIVRDRRLAATVGGPAAAEQVPADADLSAEWHQCVNWWADGLADPARRDTVWDTPLGEMSFEQATTALMTGEITIHTWDLARALGVDETLDPEAVHRTYIAMKQHSDALRRPGVLGPQVEAPDDSDEQTRLLAFTGRDV
jgi:uncharacterized protein (TIGR03086 family)